MSEKVYRAFSFFPEHNGKKDLMVVWVPLRAERIRVAPYSILLDDYDHIPRNVLSLAKGYCDEFFGLDELNLFKIFMKEKREITVLYDEYDLPLQWQDGEGNPSCPIRYSPNWQKVFSVKGNEVIDLPFEVDGYSKK
ncbi:MAG: hypothetical protein WCQ97_02515 [Aminobacterium sp.]|jgi:hypothetical protein|uniref:hypothetical protein n=1 Tax=unclassified Aminobacterium TaxID=2685012 RepID=UPI001BCCAAE2|nr:MULTISPECIES: hypothetical protein [unclassified Aminobacterium]MDD2206007.1 hypothetical protein [Aminobacterium sp.]MDD3425876.1 hypothetical protein [Aminobacterium sp.]MDD3707184.1 hypothetical protein [Aminobacterium sp.]MDD4227836.1 hypothetical protein [Aminobacterium sp.]MDD4550724.1 hypothetical protein [Aminobacterium sp.]